VQGEAGTGNVVEAVRHARTVNGEIRKLTTMDENELYTYSKTIGASSYSLLACLLVCEIRALPAYDRC
jgi:pyridoxal 5'-phosphate synthase pdxS subunit